MEYRTHNQELLSIISKDIDSSDSLLDVWMKFKDSVNKISVELHSDIQDYGIAIEFYQDSLYLRLQIENSNQGFDFMEQASIIITLEAGVESNIDMLTLDLWKEELATNEAMFNIFESHKSYDQLIHLKNFSISYDSNEI